MSLPLPLPARALTYRRHGSRCPFSHFHTHRRVRTPLAVIKEVVTSNFSRWYQEYYPLVKGGPIDRRLGDWAAVPVVPDSWVDIEIARLAAEVGPSKTVIKSVIGQFLLKKRSVQSLQTAAKNSIALKVLPKLAAWKVEISGLPEVKRSEVRAACACTCACLFLLQHFFTCSHVCQVERDHLSGWAVEWLDEVKAQSGWSWATILDVVRDVIKRGVVAKPKRVRLPKAAAGKRRRSAGGQGRKRKKAGGKGGKGNSEDDGDDEMLPNGQGYVVEAIKGVQEVEVAVSQGRGRKRKLVQQLQYLVSWQDYPSGDDSWEPADEVDAPDLIAAYLSLSAGQLRK
jgi:hypothetical protein